MHFGTRLHAHVSICFCAHFGTGFREDMVARTLALVGMLPQDCTFASLHICICLDASCQPNAYDIFARTLAQSHTHCLHTSFCLHVRSKLFLRSLGPVSILNTDFWRTYLCTFVQQAYACKHANRACKVIGTATIMFVLTQLLNKLCYKARCVRF